jgi:arsenate reductase (thioredoxin)
MSGKKKVLFVCVENSCRSQIAEAFANFYGAHVVEAYSSGSNPSGKVNPDAVIVMKEENIDISGLRSKNFRDLPIKDFDYIVTMGCEDVCPYIPGKKHIEWDIEDPKGKSLYFFRQVREKIREKVRGLIRAVIAEESLASI